MYNFGWMVVQSRSYKKKKAITIVAGFIFMYAGFIIFLYPMIISSLTLPLNLSSTPRIFSFEDELKSVSKTSGTPLVFSSPIDSRQKAVECQNGDFIIWDLESPEKTVDLTFNVYWKELPTLANETLSIAQIWALDDETWLDIFITTLYCDLYGNRGWNFWTRIPDSYSISVSSDIVYALETDRWYTIRMTADLNTGNYKLYLDTIEIASITANKVVPDDIYIDFFRLGVDARGNTTFVNYYDDVMVSLLDSSPPPSQWSLRITSSQGGSTDPCGTMILDHGENITAKATPVTEFAFIKWIFDGMDYSINSTITLPPQAVDTQHTLHAVFETTSSEFNWLPLQMIAVGIIVSGGYLLWSQNKKESAENST